MKWLLVVLLTAVTVQCEKTTDCYWSDVDEACCSDYGLGKVCVVPCQICNEVLKEVEPPQS